MVDVVDRRHRPQGREDPSRHPTAESTASPSTRTHPATMTSPVLYPVEGCGRRCCGLEPPAARRRAVGLIYSTRACSLLGNTHERGEGEEERRRMGEVGGCLQIVCSSPPCAPPYIGAREEGGGGQGGVAAAPRVGPTPKAPQTLTLGRLGPGRDGAPHMGLNFGPMWVCSPKLIQLIIIKYY